MLFPLTEGLLMGDPSSSRQCDQAFSSDFFWVELPIFILLRKRVALYAKAALERDDEDIVRKIGLLTVDHVKTMIREQK